MNTQKNISDSMNSISKQINFAIGVDVGGSHITAGLVDLNKRQLVANSLRRQPVNAHGSAEEIIEVWSNVIGKILKLNPMSVPTIGIAMPGPFDYENGISLMQSNMNKFEALYGMNIKTRLSEKLNIPAASVFFRNDAEAFLAGEVMCGAAHGFNKAIGVTLGTGLGTAVHTNGKTNDVAMGVNTPFLETVAEDYISTRWFVKRYFEMTGKTIEGVKELIENISTDKIVAEIFAEFRKNLLAFLTIFIEKDIPDVVVVGGNIANALTNYFLEMQNELQKKFPNIQLRKAELGENAALIGAAYGSVSVDSLSS